MNLVEQLAKTYLAQGLTGDEVSQVASVMEIANYDNMGEIVHEGNNAVHVFVLLEGKALVQTSTGDTIARLTPGAIIGEIALFGHNERTANVVSDGPSVVAKANADRLNDVFAANPVVGVKVLRNLGKTLCERLRSSNIQLESVLNAGF